MTKSLLDILNKNKQKIVDRQAGSKNTYKFKPGTTTIRILPSWRGEDHENPIFSHPFGQSFIKDMDGKTLAVVGDAKLTYEQDCPVRNLIYTALSGARTEAQRKHYKDMLASGRELVNALILDDKEVDPKTPEIVDFSSNQWEEVLDQLILIAKGGDNPLSLSEGFDLIVTRVGKGKNDTKYTMTFARKPSAVDEDVMRNINDLDAYIRAKFADSERALNAIKAVTQGESLAITDRSTDMGTRREQNSISDADYSIVDDAKVPFEVEPIDVPTSQDEIDALFASD